MPVNTKRFFPLFALPLLAVMSSCGNKNASTAGGSNSAQTSTQSGQPNQISVISPNGRETTNEFEAAFKKKHPDVKIKWLSTGGSSDDLRFVQSQFKGKAADKGIGIDVFFGGGADSFQDMENGGLLQALPSDYGVPQQLNGVPMRDADNKWVGSALSSFGILYNKAIMQRDGLPVPRTWADMGDPKLRNRIALADPRHSGSAHMAYEIILQANGWDKGWRILTAMAGNARSFGKSSSGLLDAVSSGEAVAAPAIDFYARTKTASAEGKLGYIEPQGQRVVTADPIGVLRGAPNAELAKKFVSFVMSPEGQKIWMLPVGAPGGPQKNELGRQPALPTLYKPLPANSLVKTNPYASKNNFEFDPDKAALRRRPLDDLIGAVLIDNLSSVQAKWKSAPDMNTTGFVPLPEAELSKLAPKWNDATFRNAQISAWNQKARAFFGG